MLIKLYSPKQARKQEKKCPCLELEAIFILADA